MFAVPFPPGGPSAGGYSSPNVEFVKNFPQHTDSAGGRKLGDYFYITTERDLAIYDVSEPVDPVQVGHLILPELGEPVFTEEDPDTNGRILLISNAGVLMVIDVSDKTAPKVLSTLANADDHTVSCVLDCTWMYGSEGTIVDLRDPAAPVLSPHNWQTETGGRPESMHDVTEVSPGVVLTSTQPLRLLDARLDPEHPQVLGSTPTEPGRFTHANLWPRGGTDDFVLVGGEAVGPGCSEDASASFSTWDARAWRETGVITQLDEFRIQPGLPTEGRAPDSSFCVHWFDEHPYYRNGGLVAIGWYEHGTHFLKIDSDGQISEVGWFLGGGGQSSGTYWIDERTVYVADYIRGLDVLRFNGDIGSPPKKPKPPKGDKPPKGPKSPS
jgi:LVIVD repeat